MSTQRLQHLYRPGRLEVLFWGAGVVLLAAYAGAGYWAERQRGQALVMFRAAQSALIERTADADARATGDHIAGAKPGRMAVAVAPAMRAVGAPDTSAWSVARRAAWSQSAADSSTATAVLRIDTLGLEVPVFADASEINLNRGAGHIAGTALPGSVGNTAIAAHRDGYFRALQDVRLGERITVETLDAKVDYRVVRIEVVEPDAVQVLAPTDVPSLTLVTCYPFYFVGPAPQRYIVRAEQIPDASAELSSQRQSRAHEQQSDTTHGEEG